MNNQEVKTPSDVPIQQISQLQNISLIRKSNFMLSGDRKRKLEEQIKNNSSRKIRIETDGETPSTSGAIIKQYRKIPDSIKIDESDFVKQRSALKQMEKISVNSRFINVKREGQSLPMGTEFLESRDITNEKVVTPITITEMTCRACLVENSVLFPLESTVCVDNQTVPIVDILDSVTMQKVVLEGKYPANLCVTCLQHVIAAYKWIKQYQMNQETLNEICTPVAINIHTVDDAKEQNLASETVSKNNTANLTNQINENASYNENFTEAILISDEDSNMETNESTAEVNQTQRVFKENTNTYDCRNEVKSDDKNRISVNNGANVKIVNVEADKKKRVTCKECVCSMDVLSVGNHILKCKMKENAYNIIKKKYEMFICKHCSQLIQLSELVDHAKSCFAKDPQNAYLKENSNIRLGENVETGNSKEENDRKDIAKQLLNLARKSDINISTSSPGAGSLKIKTVLDIKNKNLETGMQSIRVKPMNELIGSAGSFTKVISEGHELKNVSADNDAQKLKNTTISAQVTESISDNQERPVEKNALETEMQNENKDDSVKTRGRRRRKVGSTKFTVRKQRNVSKKSPEIDVAKEEEVKRKTKGKRTEKKADLDGSVKCVYCLKIIKLSLIVSHRKKCMSPKGSYPCTSCKRIFTSAESLHKHQQKLHRTDVNYFCTVCKQDVPQAGWVAHRLKHNVNDIAEQSKSTESKGASEKNV